MELNPSNERIKHRYFQYLKEADKHGEHTIDQVAKALDRFECHTRRKSFREYRTDQAISFKKHLATQGVAKGGRNLSKATITSTLHSLRNFFEWLADQKGFRNKFTRTDAHFFNPLRSDEAISRAQRQLVVPTVEDVRKVVLAMPTDTPLQRRDRALVAFTMMTGARDNATASVRLKHLNLAERELYQDAREVRTKFRKTFSTWFFPVGEDFVEIVADWKAELESMHRFGPNDPLFPKTQVTFGDNGQVQPPTLVRGCWANASPIRYVFRLACAAAKQKPFTPHRLRNTLVELADDFCVTPGQFKAWSQNLGHEGVLTTLTSYGTVPAHKQRALLAKMAEAAATRSIAD